MEHQRAVVAGIALVAALGCVACSTSFESPPVEVQYRESLVGIGKIVRITNQHSEPLTEIEVRIENPNGDVKNHTFATLAAGETVELGWKKLDGFEVETGAEVTLQCAGFALPAIAVLVESSE